MKNFVTLILIIIITTLLSCEERDTKNVKKSINDLVEKIKEEKDTKDPIIDHTDSYNADIDAAVEITEVKPWRYGSPFGTSSSTVNLEIKFANLSNKTVKYVYCNVRAYNGVGDYMGPNGVDNESVTQLYMTGPFNPIDLVYSKKDYEERKFFGTKPSYEKWKRNVYSNSWNWENMWDNSTIVGVEAKITKIDFMDGTSLTGYGKTIKGEMDFRNY